MRCGGFIICRRLAGPVLGCFKFLLLEGCEMVMIAKSFTIANVSSTEWLAQGHKATLM